MPVPRRRPLGGRGRAFAAALCLAVGPAACADASSVGDGPDGRSPTGPVTVFAAASLTEAFTQAGAAIEAAHPGLDASFSFAGSGALVTQVVEGAPADLVATADTASMQVLVDAGLVDTPVTFARNRLEILVAPGNPLGVESLADLADPGLRLVLPDDAVPAGRYAAEAFIDAGVTVRPVSKEVNVKAAVAKVTSGEADAAVVYATDVAAAAPRADGVVIPDEQNVVATYPIAVLRRSRRPVAAAAFIAAVVSGVGAGRLRAQGFLPAAAA